MPGDNSATVAPGAAVSFPNVGPADGSGAISEMSATTFNLTNVGTYEVFFQVSVSEPGQLELVLNNAELAYTVVGRASPTSEIVGESLVSVTTPNSVLQVWNPSGDPIALTITPDAGDTATAASASLVILQLQ
jgi:hypothetical protein